MIFADVVSKQQSLGISDVISPLFVCFLPVFRHFGGKQAHCNRFIFHDVVDLVAPAKVKTWINAMSCPESGV